MSFDDFDDAPAPMSEADKKKYFTMPVYGDDDLEKLEEKTRDWEPMTNYRGEIIKEEHKFSEKSQTPFVKITTKFKVKGGKTKFIIDVFMMYPEGHVNFIKAFGKQTEFLRAIGVERKQDTFVKLGFIGKVYDATFQENPNKDFAHNPRLKYIDAGVVEEIKKQQEEFNDDIPF